MAIFGYNVIGGNVIDTGCVVASKFACPEAGTVSKMFVYIAGGVGAGDKISTAIYRDDLTLLAQSAQQAAVGNSWNEVPINADVVAVDYWLARSGAGGASSFEFAYDAGSVNQYFYDDVWEFPDPATPDAYFDRKISIYAEYTASGGGVAAVSGFGGGGRHHGGDKRYKDARVIDGWKVRS